MPEIYQRTNFHKNKLRVLVVSYLMFKREGIVPYVHDVHDVKKGLFKCISTPTPSQIYQDLDGFDDSNSSFGYM
jgi:hypothetical protein